jgi:flotillin
VVVTGGAKFVLPVVESVRYMDISAKTLEFLVERASTKSGVSIDVGMSAVVKVSTERTMLNRAVQQWMSKPTSEVAGAAQAAIVSAARSAAAQWEIEAITADRDGFVSKVRELAVTPFADLGLELVALHLREVSDTAGVLDALGRRMAAEAKQRAEVAAAVAGGLPTQAHTLDPRAARRADVGQRVLQTLPDLTDEQVERLAAVLDGGA